MELDPITINNPTGEAWRQCKMGQPDMMIRELVMNAIEACRNKPEKERDIRLYGISVTGHSAPKLAIWNRGGMNKSTLVQFSNINAAIDKVNAIDKNFGRGAKIASIMSNMLGLRFRSCRDGRVLEVVLAADPEREVVGRVEVPDAIDGTTFVRDVTEEYPSQVFDFLSLDRDWTEVVLFGNATDQDTTRTPYINASLSPSQWLWDAVGMRFFDIPPGVRLGIYSLITRHRSAASRENPYWSWFNPMRSTLRYAAAHTAVMFDGGVVHYIRKDSDEASSKRERRFATNFATKPFGGIVWRNEIHYLHSGTGRGQTTLTSKTWPPLALKWGLVRAYKQVSILVEINEDAATNDINRVNLIGVDGIQIDPEQFADAVRENMPDWVRKLERELEPKEDDAIRNIREYLRDLMREFKNQADDLGLGGDEFAAKRDEDGQGDGQGGGGNASDGSSLKEAADKPNASQRKRPMDAPHAQWVGEGWFDEMGLHGMGAYFKPQTKDQPAVIFFNEDHQIFRSLVSSIAARMPEEASRELVYDIAQRHAKHLCYLAVGTHVVAGLSLLQSNLKQEDVLSGLGAVVLSTAMATARFTKHFVDTITEVKRELKQYLGSIHKEAAA